MALRRYECRKSYHENKDASGSANVDVNSLAEACLGDDAADVITSAPTSTARVQVIAKRTRNASSLSSDEDLNTKETTEYYVHFMDADRRLDQWICACRVIPLLDDPTATTNANTPTATLKKRDRDSRDATVDSYDPQQQPQPQASPSLRTKRSRDEISPSIRGLSKVESEQLEKLEKIREEKTKIKNVGCVVFGDYVIDAWYYSPYCLDSPWVLEKGQEEREQARGKEELHPMAHLVTEADKANVHMLALEDEKAGTSTSMVLVDYLYICSTCLKYYQYESVYVHHRTICQWKHPPGILIYKDQKPFESSFGLLDNSRSNNDRIIHASSSKEVAETSRIQETISPPIKNASGPIVIDLRDLDLDASVPGMPPSELIVKAEPVNTSTSETLATPGKEESKTSASIVIYEVDGELSPLYCQNLCLLAKLFLDHKTLHFDVCPFLFYVVCEMEQTRGESGTTEYTYNLAGFFSKEKPQCKSPFNLACIMSLPPYQGKGYGNFLIALSYELSKREGKEGSPERPLSDMGLVAYKRYWTRVLLSYLKQRRNLHDVSIKELSDATGILQDDVISTLKAANLLTRWKGEYSVPSSMNMKQVEDALANFEKGSKSKTHTKVIFRKECLSWGGPLIAGSSANGGLAGAFGSGKAVGVSPMGSGKLLAPSPSRSPVLVSASSSGKNRKLEPLKISVKKSE